MYPTTAPTLSVVDSIVLFVTSQFSIVAVVFPTIAPILLTPFTVILSIFRLDIFPVLYPNNPTFVFVPSIFKLLIVYPAPSNVPLNGYVVFPIVVQFIPSKLILFPNLYDASKFSFIFCSSVGVFIIYGLFIVPSPSTSNFS